MDGPLDRRSLLLAGGSVSILGLSGCASISAAVGLRTQELGELRLANAVDEPAEIELAVRRDGTTVHESSHRLDPGSTQERTQITVDDWGAKPTARSWLVRARRSGGEWRDAELHAAWGDADDCHSVDVVAGDWPEAALLVLPTSCRSG